MSKGEYKKIHKEVKDLPTGNRMPSSNKAAIGANVALAAVPGGASTAALNAAKLGTGTKTFSDSKLGKKIGDKMVGQPIRKAMDRGAKGEGLSKFQNTAKSVGLNPFTAEAERLANKTARTHKDEVSLAKKILKKN